MMQAVRTPMGVGALVVGALAVAACGGDSSPLPAPPSVEVFVASPARVQAGKTATLRWRVRAGSSVEIGPRGGPPLVTDGPPSGEAQTGPITLPTTFALRTLGPGGLATAAVEVEVDGAPPIIRAFLADRTQLEVGQVAVLRWSVEGATSVRIDAGLTDTVRAPAAAQGTATVSPAETTVYRLVASGPGGTSQSTLRIVVTVPPPQIVRFSLDRSIVAAGGPIRAEWHTRFADRVQLRAGDRLVAEGDAIDGATISLFASTDLVLWALGPSGVATATAAVIVTPLEETAIASFIAAPNPVGLGSTTTLRWSVSGAAELTLARDGEVVFTESEPPAQGWTEQAIVAPWSTFTLSVRGPRTTATATVTVVGHAPPVVEKLSVDPAVLSAPGPVILDWMVRNVSYLTLTENGAPVPGFGGVDTASATVDARGTITRPVGTPTRFTLTAASAADVIVEEVIALVGTEEMEPNDSPEGAQTLTGTTGAVLGALGPGDVDVYRVNVPSGASLVAATSFGPDACRVDTRLWVLAPDGVNILAEDDDDGPWRCSRIDPTRDAGVVRLQAGDHFLTVAHGNAVGPYVLTFSLTAPVCGNGTREASEACDDGNVAGGDGCSTGCQFELSGPPIVAPGGTRLLGLPGTPGFSVVAVDIVSAGQSITATAADPGGSTCSGIDTRMTLVGADFIVRGARSDGGPSGSAGACASLIPQRDVFPADLPVGRHYLLVEREGGTAATAELAVTVTEPACGNAIVEQRAGEQCDDGNLAGGDGCSGTCRLEVRRLTEREPNGTQGTATTTGLTGLGAVTIAGANDPAGDNDVYRVDVPAGRSLSLSARTYTQASQPQSCNSNLTDTRIFVEQDGVPATQPGGPALAFNDDIDNANNVWCSAINGLRLNGGLTGASFFVRVQGWNNQRITRYQLDLALSP